MNLLAGAAKEIHRELAEPGREACTPVALSDTLLPQTYIRRIADEENRDSSVMIEPLHSLAFSIQANPGVYVVLVGSGVSRAAKIPTGWEVARTRIHHLGYPFNRFGSQTGKAPWRDGRTRP